MFRAARKYSAVKKSLLVLVLQFPSLCAAADPVIYDQSQSTIKISQAQPEFIIKLKSNPTTGYSWKLTEYDKSLLRPVTHSYVAPNTKLIGAPGFEMWTFSVKPAALPMAHDSKIKFDYVRPWEDKPSVNQAEFVITTK